MRRESAQRLACLLLTTVTVGCTVRNESHCGNGGTVCGDGEACDECEANNDGCVPAGQVTPGCEHTSGSGDTTATTGPSTSTTEVGTDSVTTSSSGPTTSTMGSSDTAPGCMDDEDCAMEGKPYCEGGTCVGCEELGGTSCAEKNAAQPVCDGASGQCVQCTEAVSDACTGTTPVCDAATQECTACTEHGQCSESACNLETGGCMPTDEVYWVDNAKPCPGAGTRAAPYCAISSALSAIGDGQAGTIVIQGGGAPYTQQISLTTMRTVALLGKTMPQVQLTNGQPTVDVVGGSKLYLSAVNVAGNSQAAGLECSGAGTVVWVDDARVGDNTGTGLTGQTGCNLTIRRSEIVKNDGGGITLTGGSNLELYSSVIGSNGLTANDSRGISAQGSATSFSVVYATIAGNAGMGSMDSIECLAGATGTVRNSIIVAEEDESISCPTLTLAQSAARDAEVQGGTNSNPGAFSFGWFQAPGTGNFHLTASGSSVFKDVALWQSGDPAWDLDGDARPTQRRSDWAGADRP